MSEVVTIPCYAIYNPVRPGWSESGKLLCVSFHGPYPEFYTSKPAMLTVESWPPPPVENQLPSEIPTSST